jgi:hypothetical protein
MVATISQAQKNRAALRFPASFSLSGLQFVCVVLHEAFSVAVPANDAHAAAMAFDHHQAQCHADPALCSISAGTRKYLRPTTQGRSVVFTGGQFGEQSAPWRRLPKH